MFAISCNKRAMTLGTAGTFFCFFFSFFCGLWNLKSDDKKWRKKNEVKKKKLKVMKFICGFQSLNIELPT